MRVLVAVARNLGCVDPIAAVTSFTWPPDTKFAVITVSEQVRVPAMAEVIPGALDVSDTQRAANASADMAATTAAGLLEDHGLQAVGVAKEGDPKDVIVQHAEEWGADLIVVGSCEKSRIEKFLLGSVSESVVKRARCSVLVVKPETRDNR